jgi:hypothetical protein
MAPARLRPGSTGPVTRHGPVPPSWSRSCEPTIGSCRCRRSLETLPSAQHPPRRRGPERDRERTGHRRLPPSPAPAHPPALAGPKERCDAHRPSRRPHHGGRASRDRRSEQRPHRRCRRLRDRWRETTALRRRRPSPRQRAGPRGPPACGRAARPRPHSPCTQRSGPRLRALCDIMPQPAASPSRRRLAPVGCRSPRTPRRRPEHPAVA